MNFLYDEFPNYTYINKEKFLLQTTNFRDYLKFFDVVNEKGIDEESKYIFLIEQFYKEPQKITDFVGAIEGLLAFLNAENSYYDEFKEIVIEEDNEDKQLISFKQDAGILYASFLQFYGIDLREIEYMHWWKFKLLLDNIDENSQIAKVISIRACNLSSIKDKEERKRIRKLKQLYAIKE